MSTVRPEQVDDIAALIRARGQHPTVARREWLTLSWEDQEWWREDVRRALRGAKVAISTKVVRAS